MKFFSHSCTSFKLAATSSASLMLSKRLATVQAPSSVALFETMAIEHSRSCVVTEGAVAIGGRRRVVSRRWRVLATDGSSLHLLTIATHEVLKEG